MEDPKLDGKYSPFAYQPTDYNVRCRYSDGAWGEIEISSSPLINIHIGATTLHYGQEAIEGMKACRGKEGDLRLFRWQDYWTRLNNSCLGILMPALPEKIFKKAIKTVIQLNKRFVPPYGTEGSLYIRALVIGTGARVGVTPADEYLFVIFVTPVGESGPSGSKTLECIETQIIHSADRTAPLGTGRYQIGANYAASLLSSQNTYNKGYKAALYLDALWKKYIEESESASFFAIKNNTYITPDSDSILPSITDMSLCTIAKDMGMKFERRKISVDELSDFEEVGLCGTNLLIAPIKLIHNDQSGEVYRYGDTPGPCTTMLYNQLQGIRTGQCPDPYHWITQV